MRVVVGMRESAGGSAAGGELINAWWDSGVLSMLLMNLLGSFFVNALDRGAPRRLGATYSEDMLCVTSLVWL